MPNSIQNFLYGGIKGAVDLPVSLLDLAGMDETARDMEDYTARMFPTDPGIASTLGNIVGGTALTWPVAYLRGLGYAGKATKALKGLESATLGLYGLQSAGHGRREVKEYERETGEDVSGLSEAATAVGYGAVTLISEKFGLEMLAKNIGRVSPKTLRLLGEQIGSKKLKEASKTLLHIGKVTGREAIEEGAQEMSEQIAQNALRAAIFDTDKGLLEDAGMSFIGGAIGGGFIQGVGMVGGAKHFTKGYTKQDQTERRFQTEREKSFDTSNPEHLALIQSDIEDSIFSDPLGSITSYDELVEVAKAGNDITNYLDVEPVWEKAKDLGFTSIKYRNNKGGLERRTANPTDDISMGDVKFQAEEPKMLRVYGEVVDVISLNNEGKRDIISKITTDDKVLDIVHKLGYLTSDIDSDIFQRIKQELQDNVTNAKSLEDVWLNLTDLSIDLANKVIQDLGYDGISFAVKGTPKNIEELYSFKFSELDVFLDTESSTADYGDTVSDLLDSAIYNSVSRYDVVDLFTPKTVFGNTDITPAFSKNDPNEGAPDILGYILGRNPTEREDLASKIASFVHKKIGRALGMSESSYQKNALRLVSNIIERSREQMNFVLDQLSNLEDQIKKQKNADQNDYVASPGFNAIYRVNDFKNKSIEAAFVPVIEKNETEINRNIRLNKIARVLYALNSFVQYYPSIFTAANIKKILFMDKKAYDRVNPPSNAVFFNSPGFGNVIEINMESVESVFGTISTLHHEMKHAVDHEIKALTINMLESKASTGDEESRKKLQAIAKTKSIETTLPYFRKPGEMSARKASRAGGKGFMRNVLSGDDVDFQKGRRTNPQPVSNEEADLIIKHLRVSGLVSSVEHITDPDVWNNLISEARAKDKTLPSGKVYGVFVGKVNEENGQKYGKIFLGPEFLSNTGGHELFHGFAYILGKEHPVLQKAYKMLRQMGYSNPVESLGDLVGDVYYQRIMDNNTFKYISSWLIDFWSAVKFKLGYGNEESIARAINFAMRPGMMFSRFGLPGEWDPTEEGFREELRKAGIVQNKGEDYHDTIERLMRVFPALQKKILEPYVTITERSKAAVDKTKGEVKTVADEIEQAMNKGITIDTKKTLAEVFSDRQNVIDELNKVWAGRVEDYTLKTELVWQTLVEEHRVNIWKQFLDNLGQGIENKDIVEQAARVLERVINEENNRIVTPSSMAGWRLRRYRETETLKRLFSNLYQLKEKISKESYDILFEAANGHSVDDSKLRDATQEALGASASLKDYFYEYYYSMMLSNPTTHIVNAGTNLLWLAWQVPHKVLSGAISKAIGGSNYISEVVPFLAGVKTGSKLGWKLAKVLVKKGYINESDTKSSIVGGLLDKFSIELGTAGTTAFERNKHVPKWLSSAITMPSRLLRAADLYFKSIAYDSEIRSQLYKRLGGYKGDTDLTYIHDAAKTITGYKINSDEMKELSEIDPRLSKPVIRDIIEHAVQFANYATFMDEPGQFTKGIIQMRNNIPMGRVFVPFINTLVNITKRGTEMIPVLGAVSYKAINKDKTWASKADMIAKQIEGSIITAIIMSLFDLDKLTADPPTNPAERERFFAQGKLPWSFKAHNTWIEYRDMEPFSTIFGFLGAAYQAIGKARNDAEATNIFAEAAKSFYKFISDSTWLGGVRELTEGRNLSDKIAEIPGTLVPYSAAFAAISRGINGIFEGKRTLPVKPERFLEKIAANIQKKTPFAITEKLPDRLNVFGEAISIPGGFLRQWLPWKWSEEIQDPVETELARLAVYPGPPRDKITISGREIQLPPEVYRDYLLYFGKLAKENLQRIIAVPAYQRLSVEARYRWIDKVLLKSRGIAHRALKRDIIRNHKDLLAPLPQRYATLAQEL